MAIVSIALMGVHCVAMVNVLPPPSARLNVLVMKIANPVVGVLFTVRRAPAKKAPRLYASQVVRMIATARNAKMGKMFA